MIILKSTNPKFSWVLRKNPETQRTKNEPFSKAVRKGMAYGWFTTDQEFRIIFKDSPTESSFNTISDFEYLDRTRYASPYLPIALTTALLASAQKEHTEEDSDGFVHSAKFVVEFSNPTNAIRIAEIMPCKIELNQIGVRLYVVKMTTDVSIRFLLNCMISYLITQAVMDENLYIPMDDQSVKKYVDAMNVIDADYYVRYNMAVKCIRSPNVFKEMKQSLENGKFVMNFGDTQVHRFNAIDVELTGGNELFDIGCGELYYTKRLVKRYKTINAFDANPEIQESNQRFITNRNIENINLLGKFDCTSELPNSKTTDVLITEVLEHMPQECATDILNRLLGGVYNKIVITVPNKDFNRFYGLSDEDIRHPDHDWEPTEEEFKNYIQNVVGNRANIRFFDVGDGVICGDKIIRASIGVVLEMK